MSHIALQRVMVRMLFDGAFAARVYADSGAALTGLNLTADERAWLARPDPRAWTADPHRAARSMEVFVQQYPAALALAVRALGSHEPILDYFRSDLFHHAIQTRASISLAFAVYLRGLVADGRVTDPRVAPVAGLEEAIVRLHLAAPFRPPEVRTAGERYCLSPDKRLHRAPRGTADLHEAVHGALLGSGTGLQEGVLAARTPLPTHEVSGQYEEQLLLELARDEGPRVKYAVGAAEITEALYDILDFARVPRVRKDLLHRIAALGADESEAPDILDGLVEEGLLIACVR